MRKYSVPAGKRHIQYGVTHWGPCEIDVTDDEYSALVGIIIEERKERVARMQFTSAAVEGKKAAADE